MGGEGVMRRVVGLCAMRAPLAGRRARPCASSDSAARARASSSAPRPLAPRAVHTRKLVPALGQGDSRRGISSRSARAARSRRPAPPSGRSPSSRTAHPLARTAGRQWPRSGPPGLTGPHLLLGTEHGHAQPRLSGIARGPGARCGRLSRERGAERAAGTSAHARHPAFARTRAVCARQRARARSRPSRR